ncbi:MAG: DUF5305 domain-containing protein [Tissierellia bacterium]|nr:DUF5305 domain-containing protein [Tissierellia bacterium]
MKFGINKNLRMGLIIVLIIAIAVISFFLYREVKYPRFEEQNVPVYSYNNKASVGFAVYFKPNELYETESMDKEQIYLTEFVDRIKANFNYEFSADRDASINGSYDIIAKAQGYTTDLNGNIKIIWEKDFTLVPEKNFTINRKVFSLNESVDIKLADYNAFVARIIEASNVNSQASLNVIMNIRLQGDTDYGPVEEAVTPSLTIPLNSPTIEISGNREIEQPGAIEETRQVQLPVNRNRAILYGIIIGVLGIIACFLIFFTEGILRDQYEKTLKQIFKKYGDRFVALNSEIVVRGGNIVAVKSIDDLVRISDELGKPIIYKYSSNYREINKFHVIDENKIYMLDLSDLIEDKKPDEAVADSSK